MYKKLVIIISILLYVLSAYFSYIYFSKGNAVSLPVTSLIKYEPPRDATDNIVVDDNALKTEECPTNGELLTKSHKALWETRRPLTVMVENSTAARPQSGLTSADVVYEAVAEGGITRFLVVYYCKDSDGYIGPIRSARVYFVDFASEYGLFPLYVHIGGANCNRATGSGCANGAPADALGKIGKLGWNAYNDLNHIPFPVMWRDYDRLPGRATEHTVYSTTQKLWEYAKKERGLTNVDKNGDEWEETFQKWKFKDDEPVSSPISKIDFSFWENKSDYDVTWEYDSTTNSYKRLNGGKPHVDKNNDQQITAKNVVVAFMKESAARDNYDAGQRLLYQTVGEDKALIFVDGTVIKGKWRKKDGKTRIRFYNSSGGEIALNRGLTFIEIVPEGNEVDY